MGRQLHDNRAPGCHVFLMRFVCWTQFTNIRVGHKQPLKKQQNKGSQGGVRGAFWFWFSDASHTGEDWGLLNLALQLQIQLQTTGMQILSMAAWQQPIMENTLVNEASGAMLVKKYGLRILGLLIFLKSSEICLCCCVITKWARTVWLKCIQLSRSMINQNAAECKGYYLDRSSVFSSGVITTCSGTSCGHTIIMTMMIFFFKCYTTGLLDSMHFKNTIKYHDLMWDEYRLN